MDDTEDSFRAISLVAEDLSAERVVRVLPWADAIPRAAAPDRCYAWSVIGHREGQR